jgi:ribose-phosphate pyrophosphokinase
MLNNSAKVLVALDGPNQLVEDVCSLLRVRRIGCEVEVFRDGEMAGRVLETVTGLDVILQHSCTPPAVKSIFELLLLIDACRRGGAIRVTVIAPYLAFTRGDKRNGRIESIAGRMIADFMDVVGATDVICIDPHFPQFEGFCRMRASLLSAVPLLSSAVSRWITTDAVIVAPDQGSVRAARLYGQLLASPVIVLDKTIASADLPDAVRGAKLLILVDDIISTGSSMTTVIRKLRSCDVAAEIWVSAVHGLFLDSAVERLSAEGVSRIFITDTLPQAANLNPVVTVVGTAELIASALQGMG